MTELEPLAHAHAKRPFRVIQRPVRDETAESGFEECTDCRAQDRAIGRSLSLPRDDQQDSARFSTAPGIDEAAHRGFRLSGRHVVEVDAAGEGCAEEVVGGVEARLAGVAQSLTA